MNEVLGIPNNQIKVDSIKSQIEAVKESDKTTEPTTVISENPPAEKTRTKRSKKEKKEADNKAEASNNPWTIQVDNYSPVNYTAKSVLADLNADVDLFSL